MRKRVIRSIKLDVHKRDDFRCQKCGRCDYLHAHHIVADMDGGPYTEENLMTLCEKCHMEWHFVESISRIPFDAWIKTPPYITLFSAWQQTKGMTIGNGRDTVESSTKTAMMLIAGTTMTEDQP